MINMKSFFRENKLPMQEEKYVQISSCSLLVSLVSQYCHSLKVRKHTCELQGYKITIQTSNLRKGYSQ